MYWRRSVTGWIQVSAGGQNVDSYSADIVTANDYYPFGMSMPGRKYDAGSGYRYGFNGKEKDAATTTEGYDYGARIYDGRIGRWLSIDPSQVKYPHLTPYGFCGNDPINSIDLNGKDTIRFTRNTTSVPSRTGLSGMQLGGSTMGGNSVTVIQVPGKDVFLYEVYHSQADANGNFVSSGKPQITEFFPNETKSSGLTESWCTDGCFLPGYVNDLDHITLTKWAPTDLVKYLKVHDPDKYGSLGLDQAMTKIAGAVFSGVDVILFMPVEAAEAGIIYERIDLTQELKPYVGQAKSEERYLKRIKEHARAHPNSDFEFKIIDRGKPGKDLNVKEQKALDNRGGPTNKSNPNGGTSNKKNVIKKTG